MKSRWIRAEVCEYHSLSSLLAEDAVDMWVGLVTCNGTLGLVDRSLQRALSAFVITDADRVIHARNKNLAITNLASACRAHNGLDRLLHHGVREHHLQLDLGQQVHGIFPSAIKFGVPLLSAVAAHFHHRHALDADVMERRFHSV